MLPQWCSHFVQYDITSTGDALCAWDLDVKVILDRSEQVCIHFVWSVCSFAFYGGLPLWYSGHPVRFLHCECDVFLWLRVT